MTASTPPAPVAPRRRAWALVSTPSGRGGVFVVLLAVVIWAVPYALHNQYQLRVATLLVIYAVFTVGLEFTMGRVGQISLGHGGFFAVGAYIEGILQLHGFGPWVALLAAAVGGAIAGGIVGLPVLRVAGPYLAVITIGFALTVQALLYAFVPLTGGANGLSGIGNLSSIGLGGDALGTYYGTALLLILALIVLIAICRGRFGLALGAITDSPVLARASGVNVPRVKLGMFAISATIAAVAGAAFATTGFISPDSFSLQASLFPVAALVLGGIGTLPGPVVGAFLLIGFNQLAQQSAQGSELLYGLLLCIVPLVLSRGLVGLVIRGWNKLRGRQPRVATAVAGPRSATAGDQEQLDVLDGASLVLDGVGKRFKSLQAVQDVSFQAAPGEVIGLVGPNGSGKSTLLNMISGYYGPSSGTISVDGKDVTRLPLHERVRRGVLPTFQTAQLMSTRSIRDNLALGAVAHGRWGRAPEDQRLERLLGALDASLPLRAPAGSLPEGQRKIVELGRALLARPRLLLLDEPTSGLSQQEVDRVRALLQQLTSLGVTIVVADHNFEFVGAICHRVVVLESGKILATGTAAQLREQEDVVEAYLGHGMAKGAAHAADAHR